jgi:hypothetical protein
MGDDIPKGHITMKLTTDLWLGIEKAENPEAALHQRVMQEFYLQGFNKGEIDLVSRDGVLSESVSRNCRETMRRFRGWRRSLPGSLTFEYQRPGTRKKSGAPMKEPAS